MEDPDEQAAPQDSRPRRTPRRLFRNISVATRLALVVVLVALISVVITSYVGLQRGRDLASAEIDQQLESTGAARADQVELYIAGLERVVRGQALSTRTAHAIETFVGLYDELQIQGTSARTEAEVDAFYRDVVAPELAEVRDRPVNPAGLKPVAPAAIDLQAEYVVPPDDDISVPPPRLTDWAATHDPLDESFRELVERIGADDLYLIAPNGVIVYSAAKDIDFATSLSTGPYSGSGLATLINSLEQQPGAVGVRDFAPYTPAMDQPSAFVASPIVQDGAVAGYIALRFGPAELTSIMTNDESWDAPGDKGETFVVAADDRMRSDSRAFLEDEQAYYEAVSAAGTATDDQIRSMEVFDTTVLYQPIDRTQVENAFLGESDVAELTNYLGVDVLSSGHALDIDGLDWVVFAQADVSEIEQPISDFVRNLLVAIAVFIVVVTFLAVRWADRLLEPLRVVSTKLRAVRVGGAWGDETVLPDKSAKEFVELAGDIDTMVDTLRQRSATASHRAEEHRDVLRRLLPPAVAERAEAGDRDVVEQIAAATVAVIVLEGIGPLMRDGSAQTARRLLDTVVEEADDVANERGLDRVRLTGDAYVAVCGATRPFLDHASRAANFVLDVRELVHDLDLGEMVDVRAGVASGPLTIGLTGGHRLVHDTWGATVQEATDLARLADHGQVLLSSTVTSQLSSSFLVEPAADGVSELRERSVEADAR